MGQQVSDGNIAVRESGQVLLHRIIVLQFVFFFEQHGAHGYKLLGNGGQVEGRLGTEGSFAAGITFPKGFLVQNLAILGNECNAVEKLQLVQGA